MRVSIDLTPLALAVVGGAGAMLTTTAVNPESTPPWLVLAAAAAAGVLLGLGVAWLVRLLSRKRSSAVQPHELERAAAAMRNGLQIAKAAAKALGETARSLR